MSSRGILPMLSTRPGVDVLLGKAAEKNKIVWKGDNYLLGIGPCYGLIWAEFLGESWTAFGFILNIRNEYLKEILSISPSFGLFNLGRPLGLVFNIPLAFVWSWGRIVLKVTKWVNLCLELELWHLFGLIVWLDFRPIVVGTRVFGLWLTLF